MGTIVSYNFGNGSNGERRRFDVAITVSAHSIQAFDLAHSPGSQSFGNGDSGTPLYVKDGPDLKLAGLITDFPGQTSPHPKFVRVDGLNL